MRITAKKNLILLAAALIGAVSLYIIFIFSFWFFSEGKIYPNIKLAGIEIGSLTKDEAVNKIQAEVLNYQKEKINFSGKKSFLIEIESLEPNFKVSESVDMAYNLGRKKTL